MAIIINFSLSPRNENQQLCNVERYLAGVRKSRKDRSVNQSIIYLFVHKNTCKQDNMQILNRTNKAPRALYSGSCKMLSALQHKIRSAIKLERKIILRT